jgi:hypothetical protein
VAPYGFPDEGNIKQELLFPRLNKYYECMADSILKSHESFVPSIILRGMYSLSSGNTNIIRYKGK